VISLRYLVYALQHFRAFRVEGEIP
jgi:hypothetical protein